MLPLTSSFLQEQPYAEKWIEDLLQPSQAALSWVKHLIFHCVIR